MKIAFTGPSGAGKTTIREVVNKSLQFTLPNGSPSRMVQHKMGIPKTIEEIIQTQISMFLTKEQIECMDDRDVITDRAYIDSYLYFYGKLKELGALESHKDILEEYKLRCIENDKKYDLILLIAPFSNNITVDDIRTSQYNTDTYQKDYYEAIRDIGYDNLKIVDGLKGDIAKRCELAHDLISDHNEGR